MRKRAEPPAVWDIFAGQMEHEAGRDRAQAVRAGQMVVEMKIGKLPVNAMKRSVFGQIRTKRNEVVSGAGIGKDCAIFAFCGERRMASCVQEAVVVPEKMVAENADMRKVVPVEDGVEPGMTMPDLIQKCVNNLWTGGARPIALSIALLLPEDTEESLIRNLMADAERKCRELSIEIAGGQTRITRAVSMPCAVVTGYGETGEVDHSAKAAAPGQDIILSKWIGLEGTAIGAKRCRDQMLERYPAYLVEEAAGFSRYLSVQQEAETAVRYGVCAMHDASEGGILAALWELAEGAGTGLRVDMRRLPLRQETVEVCECLGLNPYELCSGGCLVMTAWDGIGLTAVLEKAHIPAVIVGKITEGNDRILVNGDEIRYLDRPQDDWIYKVMTRKERDTK